jgi:hypothetical protein
MCVIAVEAFFFAKSMSKIRRITLSEDWHCGTEVIDSAFWVVENSLFHDVVGWRAILSVL